MNKVFTAVSLLCCALILAGCNTSQVLTPSLTNNETAQTTNPVLNNIRVRFDPVVGAPADAATQLETQLLALASQRGLQLVGANDSTATHIAQGYFSVISENGSTTVIYVWDISNAAGARVHRIQGQMKAAEQGGEGWVSIGPETMQAIATQTMNQLTLWLATSAG